VKVSVTGVPTLPAISVSVAVTVPVAISPSVLKFITVSQFPLGLTGI